MSDIFIPREFSKKWAPVDFLKNWKGGCPIIATRGFNYWWFDRVEDGILFGSVPWAVVEMNRAKATRISLRRVSTVIPKKHLMGSSGDLPDKYAKALCVHIELSDD